MKTFRNFLKEDKDYNELLWDFLKTSSDVAKFAKENEIDYVVVMNTAIELLRGFVGFGKSVEVKDLEVDKDQLEMGVKIEHEHTNSDFFARKIAMDHLAEIPDYYSRLVEMEKQAKK